MSLILCLGLLAGNCTTPATEIPFAAGPQSVPHSLSVLAPSGRKQILVSLSGATFDGLPTSTQGTIAATDPRTVVFVTDALTFEARNFRINVSGSDLGEPVRAYVRVVDPNGPTVLAEQTYTIASVRGVDRFRVPFFNPSTNRTQETLLRVAADSGDVAFVVRGRDDAGNLSRKGQFLIGDGAARTITAAQLESQIGAPVGKWRLTIDTDAPGLTVQGLVRNAQTGTITAISDTVEAR